MSEALPRRVLAWYGDDFTGSTDVLESLASRGLPAALFLEQPDDGFLSRFEEYRAFGLAGSSRSESPAWMSERLPTAFEWLRGLGAAICHYKVCSTFDSSPEVGSIGRALEIGQRVFGGSYVPIVVGAPSLGRYVAFGNLFANAGGETHRIDRHPTMSRHPVTPMHEADLRLHLRLQTESRIESFNLLDLAAPDAEDRLAAKLGSRPDAVLFDGVDGRSLEQAGRLVWNPRFRQPFAVGSSGVEYALTGAWIADRLLDGRCLSASSQRVDRMLALSGSCSPVTEQQIAYAGRNGFALVRLDAAALVSADSSENVLQAAVQCAVAALQQGRSAILYTGGRIEVGGSNAEQIRFRHCLGERAGRALDMTLEQSGVRRVVVAGGDTSSQAGRQLGIAALTFVSALAPGAPLCRAWSSRAGRDGIEIVFKGGQCGNEDFFSAALACGS